MAWYDAGTVKVTVSSATVTGTGTKWLAGARQGEAFVAPDGRLYEVQNIASDTSLTLTKPYQGASATGQQYALAPMQGYVKELADRAAELLPALSDLGTAAKGTLTTTTIDPTSGRVMRQGDWGFGGSSGAIADQDILKNPINGIYRSGSSDSGKPDGNSSGSSYFKFGWGGTFYGLLYASPVKDSFYMRTVNNGNANAWKELMTVRQFGLGSSGAINTVDGFPGTNLDTASVGGGLYYVPSEVGAASNLPAGMFNQGIVAHRQAGSGGGQVFVSFNGDMAVRGRRSNGYNAWREVLTAGQYGLGGATASPPTGKDGINPSGWYYGTGPRAPWGGGAFFMDLPYGTSMNSGLRISTDPYTDDFYLNGGVSGKKEYRPACKLVHDKNIVGTLASGSVIEKGGNANGEWVKFADGTQICWSPKLTAPWIDLQTGVLYTSRNSSWTLPLGFVDPGAYVIFGDAQGSREAIWVSTGENRGTGWVDYKLNASFAWNTGLTVQLCAVGRWKW